MPARQTCSEPSSANAVPTIETWPTLRLLAILCASILWAMDRVCRSARSGGAVAAALPVQVLRHAKAALRTEVAQDSKGREMSWARGREERPNTSRRRIRRDRAPIAPHDRPAVLRRVWHTELDAKHASRRARSVVVRLVVPVLEQERVETLPHGPPRGQGPFAGWEGTVLHVRRL